MWPLGKDVQCLHEQRLSKCRSRGVRFWRASLGVTERCGEGMGSLGAGVSIGHRQQCMPQHDVMCGCGHTFVSFPPGPKQLHPFLTPCRMQVKCPDRRGLLSDIINALKTLPVEISTAAVVTSGDGMVRDVFEIRADDPDLTPDAVQVGRDVGKVWTVGEGVGKLRHLAHNVLVSMRVLLHNLWTFPCSPIPWPHLSLCTLPLHACALVAPEHVRVASYACASDATEHVHVASNACALDAPEHVPVACTSIPWPDFSMLPLRPCACTAERRARRAVPPAVLP